MIQLEKIGENEWCFNEPVDVSQRMDVFHDALDMCDAGKIDDAEAIIRDIISQCPDHVDAIHHLALLAESREMTLENYLLEKEAVDRALEHAPSDFSLSESRLEYGILNNRPFFRAYYGLGLAHFYGGRLEQAMIIFQNLVSLCPNDNMGARAMVVECGFKLFQPEAVLAVCERYLDDGMVGITYGHALAQIQLGDLTAAQVNLKEAVAFSPLVAKTLLAIIQSVPEMSSGYTAMGGQDEAFEYRLRSGKFWMDTQGALALLESVVDAK